MPDALHEIRERDENIGGEPWNQTQADRRALLAHIDALTAAALDLARLREALDLCGIGFAEYARLAEEPHDA